VKKAAKKAAPKKKRTPNAAFMKPMQPDDALSAVVGSGPLPRTEITKKLWQYIKRNGLQDAKVRRNINADEKLLKVFGGKKQVSMFEMTKLVNKHIK
jgi:chromatin remodeling complex protein RSC6